MKQSNLVAMVALALGACVPGERLTQPSPRGGTPRDVHAIAARDTVDAVLLRAWEDASRRALRSNLAVAPSFRERIRFPAAQPHAVAYRFTLARGERLDLRIDALDGGAALFADVFHVIDDGARDPLFRHVHAASGSGASSFEARADGEYVVRLQPKLGTGGLYDVTMGGAAALLFPVANAGIAAVGSWFGDGRDGGARRHEGVDIFAPRGTPALAVAHGYVSSVRNTPVGGRVVWLTDDRRGISYYYAHLDEQRVREGEYVSAGDTVGFVGNTGNAQGTRPHLHFGIYRPGTVAIDPAPLLDGSAAAVAAPTPATPGIASELLGTWTHVSGNRVRLRAAPSPGAAVVAELSSATPLFVLGGLQGWHRVVLEDGTSGFVSAEFTGGRGGN